MKKTVSLLLSVVMLITSVFCVNILAFAQDTVFEDGITAWFDDDSGTLYLSGEQNSQLADAYSYGRDWTQLDGLENTTDVKVIDVSANIVRIGSGALSVFKNAQRVIIRSKYCSFGDAFSIPEGAQLCCFAGSEAEKFAEDNGLDFCQLFIVTYVYSKSGRAAKSVAFPKGTMGADVAKNETIYMNISDTHHKEYYFPTSLKIDKETGLSGDVTLTEFTRERACVFGTQESVVPPNCVYDGYRTHSCINCGNSVKIEGSEIPSEATSHTYELINKKESNCTEEGEETYVCTVCGDVDTVTIEKNPHSYDSKLTKEPTCSEVGEATYICSVCGDTMTKDVEKIPHTYEKVVTKATLKADGKITEKCTACDASTIVGVINYPKSIALSQTVYVYDGKTKKPTVTVKDSNGNVISSSNYSVSYSSGRKYAGRYKVTVNFKGDYSGSKVLYFKINPKPTTISSFTPISKGFTVKWKKQSSQVTGYQIQYSTSSNFKSSKTVTVKGGSKTSKKITGLKSKKKYYVRVRTYKIVDGTEYYSSWSAKKTVTTKKGK